MITLRQLEALVWIAQLGTFERASLRLNTTQSAISKRIQELEQSIGLAVFDRSLRGARLTEKGEGLLELAHQMLVLHDNILNLKEIVPSIKRRLRIGVTELTAITWLPRLITAIRDAYPAAVIEPEVEMSRTLHERMMEGSIDIIVVPEVYTDDIATIRRLAEVPNAWMARPDLLPITDAMPLRDLITYPILVQAGRSGSGLFFHRWLKSQGVIFERELKTESLMAMVGLTVAGLGVSYLPLQCFNPLIEQGKLCTIPVTPALPPVPYAAMYRQDQPSSFIAKIADIMQQVCDFSRQMQ